MRTKHGAIIGVRRMLRSVPVAIVLLSAGCGGSPAQPSAVIALSSASTAPGQPADVCVSMSRSAGRVSAIQMDLSWNASCASVDLSGSSSAMCSPNPATGRNVKTSVKGSKLTAVMFSFSNFSPLPDAQLFCCSFALASSSANRCCSIGVSGVRGSDAAGHAVTDIAASAGRICAAPAGASDATGSMASVAPTDVGD